MNHSQKFPQNNYGFALKILAFYVFAALLVLLAFFIPQIIFKYEDRKTSNYDIHYTAEKVDLAEGYKVTGAYSVDGGRWNKSL